MQVKYLEIWLFWGCRVDLEELVFWRSGALEESEGVGCWKYFFVLCFCLVVFWCKECWFVNLEGWEASLSALEVFRVQKDMTWMFWVRRRLFERFGVVRSSKGFDLSALSVEKLIWEVWRCLEFKNIWLKCYECGEDSLRGLEVFKVQKHLSWLYWVWRNLFERFEGV